MIIVHSLFTGNIQRAIYSASHSVTLRLLPLKDMHRFFVDGESRLEVDNADSNLACEQYVCEAKYYMFVSWLVLQIKLQTGHESRLSMSHLHRTALMHIYVSR